MSNLSLALLCGVWLTAASAVAADTEPSSTDDQELLALGESVFTRSCDYCHGRGIQKGGTFRLQNRYKDAVPALLQERTDLSAEYIRQVVRNWTLGMAAIRPTEITDSELDALTAYLTRNNKD